METVAEIASAVQGESHTSESLAWAEELHAAELHFSSELHNRELAAEQRRNAEVRQLESKLMKRSLQVELDIGRRDALRDSLILRASSVGNVLVSIAVMIGCAFMFVYQIQLPVPEPDSPEFFNFSFSSSLVVSGGGGASTTINTSTLDALLARHRQVQLERYLMNHQKVARERSGGDASLFLHAFFLWTSIAVLATALWVGLLLHLRLKSFKVHRPLFVYECGHVHSVFGSYYRCRCLTLEVAMRRMFLGGTLFLIVASCVSSWEISVVSFGSVSAGLLFLLPVCIAIVVVLAGTWLVQEETAHPLMLESSSSSSGAATGATTGGKNGASSPPRSAGAADNNKNIGGDSKLIFIPVDGGATIASGDGRSTISNAGSDGENEDEEDDEHDDALGDGDEHQSSFASSSSSSSDGAGAFASVGAAVGGGAGTRTASSGEHYAAAALVGGTSSSSSSYVPQLFLCPKLLKKHNKRLLAQGSPEQKPKRTVGGAGGAGVQNAANGMNENNNHPSESYLDRHRFHTHYLRTDRTAPERVDPDAQDYEVCSLCSSSSSSSSGSSCSASSSRANYGATAGEGRSPHVTGIGGVRLFTGDDDDNDDARSMSTISD